MSENLKIKGINYTKLADIRGSIKSLKEKLGMVKQPELRKRKPGIKASTVEKRLIQKLERLGVTVNKVKTSKDSQSFRYIWSDARTHSSKEVNKALKELRSLGSLREKHTIMSIPKGTAHGDWKDHAK